MKKRLVLVLGATMLIGSMTACGSKSVEQADSTAAVVESTEASEVMTYEFETFNGEKVVINDKNVVSQETCEEPLEWEGLPKDAEQLAPGRDCILFADSSNYYVEDVTNKLVTVAVKEVGDVIPESDYTVFDNDVFTFQYDSKYFVTMEDEDAVTVSFSNESTQTAGSNTITFKTLEGADAMEVAKEFAKQYGATEDSIQETNLAMGDVKAYAVIAPSSDESESGNRTRATSYAVINGDNVITIEILTHVEPDEGMDMFINDKIAEVIDTFAIR